MEFKTAICERTGGKVLLSDGYFVANVLTGEWLFTGSDSPEESSDYDIEVVKIVKSPESFVDWMAHLNEKSWFDAQKFLDFFSRFRKSSGIYNAL